LRNVSENGGTFRNIPRQHWKGSDLVNANQVKHAAGLEAWRQRIVECRASGRSVREWCAAYGCSPSTYYRWEREIFGGLKRPQSEPVESEQALVLHQSQALVELPVSIPDRRELSVPDCQALTPKEINRMQAAPPDSRPAAQKSLQEEASVFRPVAVLRIGEAELSLTNGVSSRLMRQLKELLGNAE